MSYTVSLDVGIRKKKIVWEGCYEHRDDAISALSLLTYMATERKWRRTQLTLVKDGKQPQLLTRIEIDNWKERSASDKAADTES